MKPRNQIVTVSLTMMAIAFMVQRVHSAPNSPPGPDVRVVNTQNNPVPVSVINFPAGTNAVVVANPTNKPVLVRQVDSGAVQPFTFSDTMGFAPDKEFGTTFTYPRYTVPAGKRLVIEYISMSTQLPL